MRAHVFIACAHYAAAAYEAKYDDSGLGYTAYQYIDRLNLRDCERSLPTSLSRIKIIAHVISCMDHQKVVGQMPYLPHRLRRPCIGTLLLMCHYRVCVRQTNRHAHTCGEY